jgi:transposase
MGKDAAQHVEVRAIIDAALRGVLDEVMAARVYELGREATVAFAMAVSVRGVGESSPHRPSGAIPLYAKGDTKQKNKRPGKPGGRRGHEGHRRATPPAPDRVENVDELKVCPDCSGPVLPAQPKRRRKRTVEDLPPTLKTEAVEYTIPQQWRPCCKKHVEPGIAAAMPGAMLGNGIVALTTVMHYGLGLTIDQTREIFASQLRTPLSAGGLVDLWRRAGEVFLPWYEQIGREARSSATLHADETGWRVNGDTHWLWCFCNRNNCCYLIDESRGSGVLEEFFIEAFRGVLITDFFAAYGAVLLEGDGARQCRIPHLLREITHVDQTRLPGKMADGAKEWAGFARTLRRLLRDGIRLRKRKGFGPDRHARSIRKIDDRLVALAEAGYKDDDAARLAKRLSRHRDELFTFLDRPEATPDNNFAERQIRPAVILRKNSQCNRSERGAATQAVLMSIYRTLKLRGLDPRAEIEQALRQWSRSGQLSPLPPRVVAEG